MVREGNDRRTDAENHRRVDLGMRPSFTVVGHLDQILNVHADHGAFLFLGIQVFDQTCLHEISPLPLAFLDLLDVAPVDQNLLSLVVHYVQWPGASAAIGGDPELKILQVELNGHLRVDVLASAQRQQGVSKLGGLLVHTNPASVEENLGILFDVHGRALHQVQDAPLLQEILDQGLCGTQGDVAHERDVLHQADRLPLRRLGRAHKAPMGVVQLPRLHQLARTSERRKHSPQVRQRRHERQAVETLGNTCSDGLSCLVLAPVAGGELVLHARAQARDLLDGVGNVRLATTVQCLLQMFSAVANALAPQTCERAAHQRTRQVDTLLSEVISVVLAVSADQA
mmetsp:Transcript_22445/g.76900  ORF Transcript_22445/g.76900 Transcript_22445/m.76900 type:complete len:341 (+) Transcript_22445:1439-2461(+)